MDCQQLRIWLRATPYRPRASRRWVDRQTAAAASYWRESANTKSRQYPKRPRRANGSAAPKPSRRGGRTVPGIVIRRIPEFHPAQPEKG